MTMSALCARPFVPAMLRLLVFLLVQVASRAVQIVQLQIVYCHNIYKIRVGQATLALVVRILVLEQVNHLMFLIHQQH